MQHHPALVTGFAPYGGRGINPAAEIASALDGKVIDGRKVVGRTLPVSYRELPQRIEALLAELEPSLVISIGLWPGESMTRIKRVGLNVASFEIPDNEGHMARDELVRTNGPEALMASGTFRSEASRTWIAP